MKIFVIIGSAGNHSANEHLVNYLAGITDTFFELNIFKDLKALPPFDPHLSVHNPPPTIVDFRNQIYYADGIIISSPEYIFSIPSALKNAFEWCVATEVFSEKPAAIITASASGQKAHEELQLILKTLQAKLSAETSILIPGIAGKIDKNGNLIDQNTEDVLNTLAYSFHNFVLSGRK